MLIENKENSRVVNFLDKGIIVSIFIFAFASVTSKGLSSIGVGLASLFWLIRIAVTKDYDFKSTVLDWSILFFLASLLISGLDVWELKVLDNSEKIILAVLFYYVVVNTITDLDLVKKLSYTVLVSVSIAAIYGFYQYFNLNVRRVQAFSFPLSFGGILAMCLMFISTYLLWGKINKGKKTGLFLFAIVLSMNLLFTKSRGAWLGFIGGSLSLAWVKDKRLIVGLMICLLILSFFLPQDFIKRFKSSFDMEKDRSNLGRIALWKGSLLMYRDHPINGVGVGRFTEQYLRNYKQPHTTNAAHAHNNFLHFLAVSGTIGFLAFCWLNFKILKSLYEGSKNIAEEKWKLFILSSLGAVVVFNIQGLTEFNFGDTEPVRFFWFLIALSVVVMKKNNLSKE